MVNWVDGEKARPLDYERDILYRLDWSLLNAMTLAEKLAKEVDAERSHMIRLTFADGKEFLSATEVDAVQEIVSFDPVYATRSVVDLVPNPWVARALIDELIAALRRRGFDAAQLGAAASYILEELRKWLQQERDSLAEDLFIGDVAASRIQFRLRADRELWKMPSEVETSRLEKARQLARNSGGYTEKSLLSPVYQDDFNIDEAEFACYIDEQKALRWWHRNVARGANYGLQGWRKNRVYPDFIFAHERTGKSDRILVWETKGDQLEGNLDTKYKRKLLQALSANYRAEDGIKAGELELIGNAGEAVQCDLVLMSEWKTEALKALQE